MTTITLAVAGDPVRIPWESPGTRAGSHSQSPIAKLVFTADFTILAKVNTNITHVIFTATLDPGFYYRPNYVGWKLSGTANSSFDGSNGFQLAADGVFQEDGVDVYHFPITNQSNFFVGAAAVNALPATVTNDFATWFKDEPKGNIQQFFINASQGVSIFEGNWMDASSSATTEITGEFRAEFFQFTIEQAQAFQPQTPTLIVG